MVEEPIYRQERLFEVGGMSCTLVWTDVVLMLRTLHKSMNDEITYPASFPDFIVRKPHTAPANMYPCPGKSRPSPHYRHG